MERNSTLRAFGKKHLVTALALAVLSLCAVVIIQREVGKHRFILEPDSVAYLSAADRLWHTHQYARYDSDPAPDWPPLTSVALIIPLLLTRSPLAAFALLNSLCFVALLLLSWAWLSRHTQSRLVAWCALALLLTALPMRHVIAAGYSEPLFTVFALASLMLLENSATQQRRRFAAACILAALACLTRYLGVTVVVTGCLLLLLQTDFSPRARLLRIAAFAGASLLPLALWCLRNHVATGTLMGFRDPAQVTFAQNLRVTGAVFSVWFLSGPVLAATCVAAVILAVLYRRHLRPVILPLAFVAIYTAALLESASHVDMDEIDSRLLFPVFVPLIWTLAQIVDATWEREGQAVWRQIAWVTWVLFCFVIGGYGITARRNADGYNAREWQNVPWERIRAALPPSGHLYSNDAPACYLFLHRSAEWLPEEDEDDTTPVLQQNLDDADGPGYYLWFDPTLAPSSENLDAANRSLSLSTIWRGPHVVLLAIPK